MRLTSRKKTILSYFEPDNRGWVTGEIGAPPLDVSGVAYLLYGTGINDNRHWLESTRRTLEAMVKDGQLEKYRSRESRSITLGGETTATVIRYGLPGTVLVVRDTEGADGAVDGEFIRLS
ncbi:hypothetical protein GEY59_02765 [Salmonella enterica subsp. enterica serovar Mikawasima]|uniref:Uncharacterized protein n=1 Tax=Salmonella enterica subsp. enterica serovar Mikawasima TaxID=149388 RepID=A0A5H6HSP6_SALET|nr:hypothetical protein [Salmonella enterica subsp. enterica serovar Mikawasima]EAA1831599.1 hypothetical protein [Salmonella enterica subsp. enterica serovar Napoli]EAB8694289.1 hypothetical protein [Salmonella enterica]ECJ2443298.1 hypothetical protein [Salmonella enterica subsp. diarizonae]EDH3710309.1 hypothetical protein [Salmonella enterica subsp. enterica]EHG1404439.1 hypothetical protein [Salmonella enterica subsp. enterica serovar Bareilly]